jgi:CRP/FNR family cyclic AMP-dependent transcriptional regulator
MATSILTLETQPGYEDALAHLPVSKTSEYTKGQVIYDSEKFARSIFLVVTGTVAISHMAVDGTEVLLDIIRPDELFGESAFLVSGRSERAEAIERTEVMTWAVSEMEDLLTKRPRLAVAMLQMFAQRNAEYSRRIESFVRDSIAQRLARSLLRFSDRLGTKEESGTERMMPLTHDLLSRYVGTSREIVSHHMNRFRSKGYVDYSRKGISLNRDFLRTVLD